LRETLERSREKVGVDPEELRSVFATALARAGTSLDAARAGEIGGTPLFRLDPSDPVFAAGGWPEALDDLRVRRRKRSEKLKDWQSDRLSSSWCTIIPDETRHRRAQTLK
jgi:hypothetical protein